MEPLEPFSICNEFQEGFYIDTGISFTDRCLAGPLIFQQRTIHASSACSLVTTHVVHIILLPQGDFPVENWMLVFQNKKQHFRPLNVLELKPHWSASLASPGKQCIAKNGMQKQLKPPPLPRRLPSNRASTQHLSLHCAARGGRYEPSTYRRARRSNDSHDTRHAHKTQSGRREGAEREGEGELTDTTGGINNTVTITVKRGVEK